MGKELQAEKQILFMRRGGRGYSHARIKTGLEKVWVENAFLACTTKGLFGSFCVSIFMPKKVDEMTSIVTVPNNLVEKICDCHQIREKNMHFSGSLFLNVINI